MGLADLGQLFGAAPPNPAVWIALSRHPGKHTLLISGFEVLGEPGDPKGRLIIDQFAAPQISWLSPGGAEFRLDSSRQHAPGPAVEVSYTAADDAIVFFARNLSPNIPASVTHISFDIASAEANRIIATWR